jgi:DNA-binding transcriptional MerR regulator
VDELAGHARLPVRTIREYQTLRLLPSPRRRGRIGVYGQEHAQRLAVIARLQRRGYSLAAIKDLLEARDDGTDVAALLGIDAGPAALDETPLRLTRTSCGPGSPDSPRRRCGTLAPSASLPPTAVSTSSSAAPRCWRSSRTASRPA